MGDRALIISYIPPRHTGSITTPMPWEHPMNPNQLELAIFETPDAASGVCLDSGAPYQAPTALTDQECQVREIHPVIASHLVRAWHSILPHIPPSNIWRNKRAVCYALVTGGWAHAVAIYTSPVNRTLSDGSTLELRRLAIAPTCPQKVRETDTGALARDCAAGLLLRYGRPPRHDLQGGQLAGGRRDALPPMGARRT